MSEYDETQSEPVYPSVEEAPLDDSEQLPPDEGDGELAPDDEEQAERE